MADLPIQTDFESHLGDFEKLMDLRGTKSFDGIEGLEEVILAKSTSLRECCVYISESTTVKDNRAINRLEIRSESRSFP